MENNSINGTNVNDLSYIKVGSKKSNMKTQAQNTIFDAIDKDKDGVIKEDEYKEVVTGKVKGKGGKVEERQYIKIKDIENGRSLVVDKNGKKYVMAQDGTVLKSSYVAAKTAQENLYKAKKSFKTQQNKDGWAGKTADAVSALWGSDNRASKVQVDIDNHSRMIRQLMQSANINSPNFKEKFQKTFGVEYNEDAVTEYLADPNEETYQKAFGNKNNINKRVENYNESQESGSALVKTGTKIVATGAAATAIVASGGTVGLVAAAGLTAASSAVVDSSDRLSSNDGMTMSDAGEIVKEAAVEGAVVLATGGVVKGVNTGITGSSLAAKAGKITAKATGSGVVGAGAEYVQTGDVTATGVATYAAIGAVGASAEEGAFNQLGQKAKKIFTNTNKVEHNGSNIVPANEKEAIEMAKQKLKISAKKSKSATKTSTGNTTSGTSSTGSAQNSVRTFTDANGKTYKVASKRKTTTSAKATSKAPAEEAPKPTVKSEPIAETRSAAQTLKVSPKAPAAETPKQTSKTATLRTKETVYDEMDDVIAQTKAMRQSAGQKFDEAASQVKAKQASLESSFAEQESIYKTASSVNVEKMSSLRNEMSEATKVIQHFQEKLSPLEHKAQGFRDALFNLQNESGGVVAMRPDGQYAFNQEITDLMNFAKHGAKQKAHAIQELSKKLGELEKEIASTSNTISQQQKALSNATNNYNSVRDTQINLDKDHNTFTQGYKETQKALEEQLGSLSKAKETAIAEIQNTPEYQRLNNMFKNLQQEARKFGI